MNNNVKELSLATMICLWAVEAQAHDFNQYLEEVDFIPIELVSTQGAKAIYKVSDDWRNMDLSSEPVMIEKDTIITAYAYHKTSDHTDYCVQKIEAPDGAEFKAVIGDVPCLAGMREAVQKTPEYQGQEMLPYAFLAKNAGATGVQRCAYPLNYWSAEDKLWMVLSYSVKCAPEGQAKYHSGSPLYSYDLHLSFEEGEGIKGHFDGDVSVHLGAFPPKWQSWSQEEKEKWLMKVIPPKLPVAIQHVIEKVQNAQISSIE